MSLDGAIYFGIQMIFIIILFVGLQESVMHYRMEYVRVGLEFNSFADIESGVGKTVFSLPYPIVSYREVVLAQSSFDMEVYVGPTQYEEYGALSS